MRIVTLHGGDVLLLNEGNRVVVRATHCPKCRRRVTYQEHAGHGIAEVNILSTLDIDLVVVNCPKAPSHV